MTSSGDTAHGLAHDTFLRDYGEAVNERVAAVFVGAGLSRASGYVDWKGLLSDFATELGLDLDIETDLVNVAQYHINENSANRNRLSQRVVDEFSDELEPTESHLTLARLPIERWWTTNYDEVVERSLRAVGRKPYTRAASSTLTVRPKGTDATVYKMHGDLRDVKNIVITRDDYDMYVRNHPGFRTQLEADLSFNTFLFVGFSFSDPHFDFILSELRRMHGENAKTHYAIMKREALADGDTSAARHSALRQQYRIKDLQRYGIQTVLVDSHEEIPELLQRLRQRYLRRQTFVSGAIDPTNARAAEIGAFSTELGTLLMRGGYNLVSGLGLGVGGAVVFGALGELYAHNVQSIDRRLLLRPFPQVAASADRARIYTQYRESMLSTAGFCIVIAGSKILDGKEVESSGIREEIAIAEQNHAYVLPIGRTGFIAQQLWAEYDRDLEAAYGQQLPASDWALLNDETASNGVVASALIRIMDLLRPT